MSAVEANDNDGKSTAAIAAVPLTTNHDECHHEPERPSTSSSARPEPRVASCVFAQHSTTGRGPYVYEMLLAGAAASTANISRSVFTDLSRHPLRRRRHVVAMVIQHVTVCSRDP